MRDEACVAFLQWALPRLGLRWPGFRKVRKTVCKRLRRRLEALGLADLDGYRDRLDALPGEWAWLDAACRITISRFYRDREVFDVIGGRILPGLAAAARAAGRQTVRAWSAGCASGEEPYSLSLSWHHRLPQDPAPRLSVVATDSDSTVLARARRGCYAAGTLKELPAAWRREAFEERDGLECLRAHHRRRVHFARSDVRSEAPDGPFGLILCRNLAFTYFDEALQRTVLDRLDSVLAVGGWLVIGTHERLPGGCGLAAEDAHLGLYRKPA